MQSFNMSAVMTGVFAVVMLVYWIGAFFILYHLMRFGVGSSPKKMAVVFLAGSLVLSIVVVLLYGQLDVLNLHIL